MSAMRGSLWYITVIREGTMKKLVIIPAYNEEGGIEKTVQDILSNAPDFDYVVINDCSTDQTLAVCEKNGFHVVNLPVNL